MPNQENQYTHELRVEGEVVRQPEAVRVVLVILSELLAESDEHPEGERFMFKGYVICKYFTIKCLYFCPCVKFQIL